MTVPKYCLRLVTLLELVQLGLELKLICFGARAIEE